MIFEVINPHDDYSIEAETFELAAIACLCFGKGYYGLRQVDGEAEMPPMFLGSPDSVDEWFITHFGADLPTCFKRAPDKDLAACLESLVIGNRTDYQAGLAECADEERRHAFAEAWHNRHRGSLSDPRRTALAFAASIRARKEGPDGSQSQPGENQESR